MLTITPMSSITNHKTDINRGTPRYRLLEALPGILSWGLLAFFAVIARLETPVFAFFIILFMSYWVANCASIVFTARAGLKRVIAVRTEDWTARLDADYPGWREHYYCTIIPFASESINVLRPTIEALASTDFPVSRRILILSSEAALPRGRDIAQELASEFEGRFGLIFVTEHVLKEGELKGKASNENHAGRFAYTKLRELGIDPAKVLVSSNDADMKVDSVYPAYLLHSYLSEGEERDRIIFQPIPADLGDYWTASFFTRMLVMSGILWRLTLHMRGGLRCTVFAFYSMSLKTLHDIGFWDADTIPEDERTMFKAIKAFGRDFRVRPLFIMTKGTSIRGDGLAGSAAEQYSQIRRWAWGASEIAHSVSVYSVLDREGRRAMRLPILNQFRTAVEWSLAPLLLMTGGFLPGLLNPSFATSPAGRTYAFAITLITCISTCLLVGTIWLERLIAPPRPESRQNAPARVFGLAQWFLSPVVSLAFGAIPALEAQTRLILNRRIAYVESRKE